jgi:hypothetical protein
MRTTKIPSEQTVPACYQHVRAAGLQAPSTSQSNRPSGTINQSEQPAFRHHQPDRATGLQAPSTSQSNRPSGTINPSEQPAFRHHQPVRATGLQAPSTRQSNRPSGTINPSEQPAFRHNQPVRATGLQAPSTRPGTSLCAAMFMAPRASNNNGRARQKLQTLKKSQLRCIYWIYFYLSQRFKIWAPLEPCCPGRPCPLSQQPVSGH